MELIIESWKSMQWEPLQKKVDEEVTAIGQRQDDDETCRIRLLDESNAYRKATTKETRKVAVPLIKAFQSEVDRLTKRGKTTEGALIDICSRLTNIPDPLPILLKASQWKVEAEKAKTATEEANQLRQSIADLHDEFADLKNQDVTIRQLRERIKVLENEKTNEVEQSIDDTERKVREEFAAREFEMNMRSDKLKAENQNLEKKISELEVKMRDAQRRLDSARLAADQRESFETEQIEILTRDLDSANRRVASLEAEIQRLTSDLADAQAASKRGGLEDIAAFGGLMKEKDEQIARLQAETSRLSESMKLETKTNKTKYEEMAKEIQHQKSLMAEMEVKLRDQKDYEEIKEQLRLLREIEFGEAATANEESIIRLGETVQSLDKLLADKNRRLQNENAQLRMSNKKLQGDDVMQAILAGSHQSVVESVSKTVGKEMVERYSDPDVDSALDKHVMSSMKYRQQHDKPTEEDSQNLFKILLNMSSPMNGDLKMKEEHSPGCDIPFEQFRYSPKLTNYTGEPSKTPQELKTIQDLQTCVTANIRNLGTKALNTAEIAKQCKRLMVAYNIGQRLFAKYVMNQSQGSLSELLSKPRHWSKLTDKGREAFRRIYGWISDEKAIDLLCSLSPRRVWPSDMDQKIEHPTPESLLESNSGKIPPDDNADRSVTRRPVASAREDQYRLAGTSQAANSGTSQRNSRWRHDDIPKEKIMSIFQTELAKIREQESSLEKAIASRTFGNGHVRRMDDLNSPYHEMSHNERMASINHAHQVMSTRMRMGLAPITQEQFEMFGHVDTEDVVRQIKDFLSMNTISQRQFGEHVLGLSQGSVSDLLARPKQWSMLTQKGREPFIRMKLFMREVAQSAERERREETRSKDKSSDEEHLTPMTAYITCTPLPAIKQELDDEPISEIDAQLANSSSAHSSCSEENKDEDEIDTTLLVRRVKDRLHMHGIAQRLFGEHVLGISAGGCSELFLRPRPWYSLNSRSKEPYLKMRTFLEDKDAITKLLSKERQECGPPNEKNENGKRLSDPVYEPSPPRKVQRTIITDQQKEALRFVFQHEQHPSQKTVELLSVKLNLNIRTVNNWFHNHRTRQKASMKEGKIYTSAIASLPKSKNWQLDLQTILDNVQGSSLFDDSLPTMVPFPPLFSNEEIREELDKSEEPDEHSSQLDKAVEKMRLLAAAKSS